MVTLAGGRSSKIKHFAAISIVLITACSAPRSVNGEEAIVLARSELFKRRAYFYPKERQSRIRCKARSNDKLWKIYCFDIDTATGGDAEILVEKSTGRVGEIWLGQ